MLCMKLYLAFKSSLIGRLERITEVLTFVPIIRHIIKASEDIQLTSEDIQPISNTKNITDSLSQNINPTTVTQPFNVPAHAKNSTRQMCARENLHNVKIPSKGNMRRSSYSWKRHEKISN